MRVCVEEVHNITCGCRLAPHKNLISTCTSLRLLSPTCPDGSAHASWSSAFSGLFSTSGVPASVLPPTLKPRLDKCAAYLVGNVEGGDYIMSMCVCVCVYLGARTCSPRIAHGRVWIVESGHRVVSLPCCCHHPVTNHTHIFHIPAGCTTIEKYAVFHSVSNENMRINARDRVVRITRHQIPITSTPPTSSHAEAHHSVSVEIAST